MTAGNTRIEQQDNDTFKSLFDLYYTGLVMYAREFALRHEEAEDVVHDVFVSLWEKRDALTHGNIRAYLFRATHNSCLNFLSHLKVRTKYQEIVIKEQKPPQALEEEYYIESELRKYLEEAINRLPPQRKKVFVMQRFEGKTFAQVAEELSISPKTVDKHIELAMKSLRKELAEYLPLLICLGILS